MSRIHNHTVLLPALLHRSIQHIMLRDEYNIEQHRDVRQPELDRIASQPGPVGLQSAVYDQLQQTEDATGEVEQLLRDAPADRGFSSEVRDDLRYVFEYGEE